MINAYTPLNNLEYTVYKPIVASMIKHFATKYLKNPDILVMYNENLDMFGEEMYHTEHVNQYKKEWLEVGYEITHDDSYMTTNSYKNNDGVVLFKDNEINYYMQSMPMTHTFNINIKVVDKFKNRLLRLLNSFQVGEINDTNYMVLNADVFFTLPGSIIELTKKIVDLKYGKNTTEWYKYLKAFSTIPMDTLNSKSGKKATPAFKAEYRDVAVWTEVGFLDKKIEREETGFSLEIVLKFSFDIITGIELFYPILIVNKPIPKEYLIISETLLKKYALPIERSVATSSLINTYSNLLGNNLKNDIIKILDHIDKDKYIKLIGKESNKDLKSNFKEYILNNLDKYIQMIYNLNYNIKKIAPVYDVWRNYREYKKYDTIGILLLQIKPNSYTYINLYELLNLGYSKEFIDTVISNKDIFKKLFGWLFYFNIYIGNDIISMDEIDIITEDAYIKEIDKHFKKGDIVNKVAIEHNKNTADKNKWVYLNVLKEYHFILYINNDPITVNQYKDSDLTLLMQYISLDRLSQLGEFKEEHGMKTVMELSVLASAINGKPKLINELLKDILKDK